MSFMVLCAIIFRKFSFKHRENEFFLLKRRDFREGVEKSGGS